MQRFVSFEWSRGARSGEWDGPLRPADCAGARIREGRRRLRSADCGGVRSRERGRRLRSAKFLIHSAAGPTHGWCGLCSCALVRPCVGLVWRGIVVAYRPKGGRGRRQAVVPYAGLSRYGRGTPSRTAIASRPINRVNGEGLLPRTPLRRNAGNGVAGGVSKKFGRTEPATPLQAATTLEGRAPHEGSRKPQARARHQAARHPVARAGHQASSKLGVRARHQASGNSEVRASYQTATNAEARARHHAFDASRARDRSNTCRSWN
jgi:hypothetical protein